MKLIHGFVLGGTFVGMITLPALAMAQNRSSQPLPPPRSYDVTPPPPPPAGIPGGPVKPVITKEAGIGGTQAFARQGVLELGGFGGFSRASSFTQLNISPTIGWFFLDNIELSGILGFNYVHTSNPDGSANNNTVMSILAEPSYHLAFTDYLFGFLGVGAGINYANAGAGGAGFALAPRVGLNVLVGRSGILTPAMVMNYSTSRAISANGMTGDHTSFGANLGYTVMW